MFKNKRFLITQPMLRGLCGSTMVTLELAEKLQQLGAIVTIYTCDFDDPAKSIFTEKHLRVDTFQKQPQYRLSDFDYIWVHSQVLPLSIIDSLSRKLPRKTPAFIFLHMSGMDWIPDEKPWIYNLENTLSSLSLFISEEVLEVNRPILENSVPIAFFRNPVPKEYQHRQSKPNLELKKLLIVSNHPPREVLEARKILIEKYKIEVSLLGENQENYEPFSKELLEKYDAVLTIAKTVPYCLISGTPVYVYDVYGGGPGWLNEKNLKNAKERNFSGYQNPKFPNYEGGVFHYKTASKIAEEIIHGYKNSLSFHSRNKSSFVNEFVLDNVLSELFTKKITPRKISPLPKSHAGSIIAAERFIAIRFEVDGVLSERIQDIRRLEHTNTQLINEKKKLNSELSSIINSGAYRTFNKIIKPYKILRKGL